MSMTTATDPLALTKALVQQASVTPAAGGALDIVQQWAEALGGQCRRLPRGEVDNLYVRFGTKAPNLCFGGHVDVVPVGDPADWTDDPFSAVERDGWLFGRGTEDMKSGVACWMAATARALEDPMRREALLARGSISLLITGDEEGPAVDGTVAVVDWIRETGEDVHSCLVGEPTNPDAIGDAIKVGRRGSITAFVTLTGKQGHAAYPHRAANPMHPLVDALASLSSTPLDQGTEHFDASSLQVVTIDTGNDATNVIPASVKATINVRFNDRHSAESLQSLITDTFERACHGTGVSADYDWQANADAFLCPPESFAHLIADACETITGRRPAYSTTGGTSDARFIKDIANVAEFGMVGRTMHQVDERIQVADLEVLTRIYGQLIQDFFAEERVA